MSSYGNESDEIQAVKRLEATGYKIKELGSLMSKFLFNVVDVWQEPDHIVVIADIPDTNVDFRHGDLLELHKPDGTVLQKKGGTIMFDPPAERPFAVVFKDLMCEDVPAGTQVYLVNPERPLRKTHRMFEKIDKSK